MLSSGDVQYDFIWRHGGADTTLAMFSHHFDPLSGGSFAATEYDADVAGIAAASAAGDQLVWRWSITAGGAGQLVAIPNGDGTSSGGRFPSITFPR